MVTIKKLRHLERKRQVIKTEPTRKLSNFNFQCTKTLYQNILSHIAFFRTLFKFIALEKCKQECNMIEIILTQGFCPMKIIITQFPNGSMFINNCLFLSDVNIVSLLILDYGSR